MLTESRKIEHLNPDLQRLYIKFCEKLQEKGSQYDFWNGILVSCTWRSNEKQRELYNIGRGIPGKIVTNARPGQSEHNCVDEKGNPCSKAFDIVPYMPGTDQHLDWNEKSVRWALIKDVWESGISIGNSYLDWYGKKGAPFRELPHFCLKYK